MLLRLNTLIGIAFFIFGNVLAISVTARSLSPRQTFTGTATFYSQGGIPGACGAVHSDSDFVVALNSNTYANGAHCGATITLTDTATGVTGTGVVADECVFCSDAGSVDLSPALFERFAPLSQGLFPVSWSFN